MVFNDLNVLSEPIRVRLLHLLEEHELGVGELNRILQLPQSTVSRHLKVLLTSGWVERRSVGTSSYFQFASESISPVSKELWRVVRQRIQVENAFAEDQDRLLMVLAMRTEDEVGFFGREAERWESVRNELFGQEYLIPLLAQLLPKNLRIVDLGCGTGELVAHLAGAGQHVVGVEPEPAMLALAKERVQSFDNVLLVQGGLDALPLDPESFDLALCSLVLHHVANLPAAFQEIHRVLNPGGRIIILDMLAHRRDEYRRSMGHKHLGFDRPQLQHLLGEAGLVLKSFSALPLSPDVKGPGLCVATATTWE